MKMLLVVTTILVAILGCSDPTSTNNNRDIEPYQSIADGTFSGALNGSIHSGVVWIEAVNENTDSCKFMLMYDSIPGFTQSEVSDYNELKEDKSLTFTSTLAFTQVPVAGTYTQTDDLTCGNISLRITIKNTTYSGGWHAVSDQDCNGSELSYSPGSFSLVLTKVTPVNPESGDTTTVFYRINGFLEATMMGSFGWLMQTGPQSTTVVNFHLTF